MNEHIALSVWNFGHPAPYKSSKVLIEIPGQNSQWISLDSNLSFVPPTKTRPHWHLQSGDMELVIKIEFADESKIKVPPIIPLFVNLQHNECFVEAQEKILINGKWVETGVMNGVMEEHHGYW